MYTQTEIQEFSNEDPANELADFFHEVEAFGAERTHRYDHVFRCFVRRDFQMAKACLNCNPEKVTFYTTKLYCNYCASNYPTFTLGDE